MSFKLFHHLDKALIQLEKREDYSSRTARIWPSEASAALIEPGVAAVVGGCHRKTYYRLIGEPTTGQMDAVGARRVRTGKAVEADTTEQAKEAGLHIASGVRMKVPHLDLSFELDLVVLDPQSGQAVICENKSIYGYMSTTQIFGNKGHKGKPKLEHLLQTLIYINEIRTGQHLKQVIADGLEDKKTGTNKRNRIDVTQDLVNCVQDNSSTYGKICYETRDTCETKEFDIGIYEDFDCFHYPEIDGEVSKVFTLESIYERFDQVQQYFYRAQKEARQILSSQGVAPPVADDWTGGPDNAEQKEKIDDYWERVAEEMRRLPNEFLPPPDYDYRYGDQKIERLASLALIGSTKYKEWKTWKNGKRRKAGIPIIGDWQCAYCPYRLTCIPLQNPELKDICSDLVVAQEEDDDAGAA